MKVVGANAFGSSKRLSSPRAFVGAVGRALQDFYASVLEELLPHILVTLVRRMNNQPGGQR
jgi:hypothetical protein